MQMYVFLTINVSETLHETPLHVIECKNWNNFTVYF